VYALAAAVGSTYVAYGMIYEALFAQELRAAPPHDGQVGMGAAYGAMYAAPVVGLVVGATVWFVIRKMTRRG
jgi:hypothetical protein